MILEEVSLELDFKGKVGQSLTGEGLSGQGTEFEEKQERAL